MLIQITAHNRGPEPATLHVLPTLWFRNTWSWGGGGSKPSLAADATAISATHSELGAWRLDVQADARLLFCDNETNNERLFGAPNTTAYPKDAINDHVIGGAPLD